MSENSHAQTRVSNSTKPLLPQNSTAVASVPVSFPTDPEVGISLADDPFSLMSKRLSEGKIKRLKKEGKSKVAEFYKNQNEIIDELLKPADHVDADEDAKLLRLKIAIYGSALANVLLFILQLVAVILSSSLSIFATVLLCCFSNGKMADAFMDIASTSVLLFAGHFANKHAPFVYPTGKRRLETAGIIVFSVLMATLSLQLIVEAVKKLASGSSELDLNPISLACVGTALLMKGLLFLYCKSLVEYPTAKVFAQDHRNDIMLNCFGITLSVLGAKVRWWLDPLGGILIALLILRSWSGTAYEHIVLIVGKSADPAFLQRVTYLTLTHDPRIQEIDTVRAYHSGNHFYVEVDIVLPKEMTLMEAHDIGETLQIKLEQLPNVERAFVHLDYETSHTPEHGPPMLGKSPSPPGTNR